MVTQIPAQRKILDQIRSDKISRALTQKPTLARRHGFAVDSITVTESVILKLLPHSPTNQI